MMTAIFNSLISPESGAVTADTTRIRQRGCEMKDRISLQMSRSMSDGWSATATFVMPDRSSSVRGSTVGEFEQELLAVDDAVRVERVLLDDLQRAVPLAHRVVLLELLLELLGGDLAVVVVSISRKAA